MCVESRAKTPAPLCGPRRRSERRLMCLPRPWLKASSWHRWASTASACRARIDTSIKVFGVGLLAFLLLPGHRVEAGSITLTLKTLEGEYRLTFDSSKFSVDQIKAFARLSPPKHYELVFLSPLELCLEGDPEYGDCGTWDIHAPNFLLNAQVNLKKSSQSLDFLRRLSYPQELRPVVNYLDKNVSFYLCVDQTRLDFYKSWNADLLKRTCQGIDPQLECPSVLAALPRAGSLQERYEFARYEWHNCLNGAFRSLVGEYPIGAWQHFLRTHGLKEELIEPGH